MNQIDWQLVTIIIAVSSLLIGVTRLLISYRQHQTFKHNISPGVRHRQQAIVDSLRQVISKVNRETYLSQNDLDQFRQETKDYGLLFDTEQKKFIKEIGQQVQALHRISVPLQTKTLSKDKWDDYSRKHMQCLQWFQGQLEICEDLFKDYVSEP